MILKRSNNFESRQVSGVILLYKKKGRSKKFFKLSGVFASIWPLIDGTRTALEIERIIVENYREHLGISEKMNVMQSIAHLLREKMVVSSS